VAGGRLGGWDAVRYGLPAIPPSSSTPPSIFNTCYVCILTFGNSNSSATDTNERLASRTSQFHSDTYGSQDRSTVTRRVCTTIPYHDHNHHVHYCHLTLQFQTMNGTFFNFVVACFFLSRRFLRGWRAACTAASESCRHHLDCCFTSAQLSLFATPIIPCTCSGLTCTMKTP
jgi:hypothetical protein